MEVFVLSKGGRPMKKISVRRFISCMVLFFFVVCVASCGYFLHPERRGQTEGKIDTDTLLLDCALLLIGILPGVVALAVDFSTGAIYLSPKEKNSELYIVRFDKTKPLDEAWLASVLSQYLGKEVRYPYKFMRVVRSDIKEKTEIAEVLHYLNQNINDYKVLNDFSKRHER
jgi:hypothetical protein